MSTYEPRGGYRMEMLQKLSTFFSGKDLTNLRLFLKLK